MKGYRTFALRNKSTGAVFDFTAVDLDSAGAPRALMIDPQGLGFEVESIALGIGARVTGISYELPPIEGTLLFPSYPNIGVAYQAYRSFIKFCSGQDLELMYGAPYDGQIFVADVILGSATKTEVAGAEGQTLAIAVSFQRLTHWRDINSTVNVVVAESVVGKAYPSSAKYPRRYNLGSLSELVIQNSGSFDIPLKVEVFTFAVDPSWSISDESGAVYGRARFVGGFSYMCVDANPESESILLRTEGVTVANPASKQDPSVGAPGLVRATYLYARPGLSVMSFSLGEAFAGSVKVTSESRLISV